jgi:tRNA nucleotidyltransferase (CCA-adding enzyme)
MAKVELDPSGRVLPGLDAVLAKALAPATRKLLLGAVAEANKQSAPLYLVGGFVRDLLLGRPSLDLDLVLEGDAISFGRRLAKRFGGKLVAHKDFGTAVWWLPGKSKDGKPAFIDLISARSESYAQPAALPKVQRAELSADQYRRDFTINSLALGLNGLRAGRLLDPWGGLRDLNSRLIRTLHPQSFVDDPTRIFRAFRFAGRLEFRLEAATLRQLQAAMPNLKLLSGERLRNELELVLSEPGRVGILQALQFFGVFNQIDKQLRFAPKAAALLVNSGFKPPAESWGLEEVSIPRLGFVLWFMHLAPAYVERIATRLRFDAQLQATVVSAARLFQEASDLRSLPASKIVERLDQEPVLALYAVFLANKGSALGSKLESYIKKWRLIQPYSNGNTLRKKGLRPGPAYKIILAQLRAARLDGKVRTAKQEVVLLAQLLDEHR